MSTDEKANTDEKVNVEDERIFHSCSGASHNGWSSRNRWITIAACSVPVMAGLCFGINALMKRTPYDDLVSQLSPKMSYRDMVHKLGKPYLSEFEWNDRSNSIYQVKGTILPLIIRFDREIDSTDSSNPEVRSYTYHDLDRVESWCAYAPTDRPNESEVLVFFPISMNEQDAIKWILSREKGLTPPHMLRLVQVGPVQTMVDDQFTALGRVIAFDGDPGQSGPGLYGTDELKVKLVCHEI